MFFLVLILSIMFLAKWHSWILLPRLSCSPTFPAVCSSQRCLLPSWELLVLFAIHDCSPCSSRFFALTHWSSVLWQCSFILWCCYYSCVLFPSRAALLPRCISIGFTNAAHVFSVVVSSSSNHKSNSTHIWLRFNLFCITVSCSLLYVLSSKLVS